jgi:hypothetical protein
MIRHDELLGMIPALAVAALDARVHEMVADGYWAAEPAARSGRTAQQARDLRRATVLVEDCKARADYARRLWHRHGQEPADRWRMAEAEGRQWCAEALYNAAWRGWYDCAPQVAGVSAGETWAPAATGGAGR